MKTKFVEVTNNKLNWGKFLIGDLDKEELAYRSKVDDTLLVQGRGWGPGHLFVFDLQTGEGAWFKLGGYAASDLNKHRIWVCPMFEPFLDWLYEQHRQGVDPFSIPDLIDLPDAEFALAGYRRPGPKETE